MGKEEKELQVQFSKKERVEKLLANLEQLHGQGSVGQEQYGTMKKEYETTLTEAQRSLDEIKQNLSNQLTHERRNLDIITHEQTNNQVRFDVGEIKAEEFAKSTQRNKAKTDKIRGRIEELECLTAVTSSAQVGGFIDIPSSSKSTSSSGSRLKFVSIVGLIGIALIALCLFLSGFFSGGQPEDVAVQFLQHMDNGEYSAMLDLVVNPTTLQPYSATEKAQLISVLQTTYGAHGENLQIDDIHVVEKERVTDDKYLVTLSAKYTTTVSGYSSSDTRTETITLVKVNGSWKVATQIPGFEAVMGVFALLAIGYWRRTRA